MNEAMAQFQCCVTITFRGSACETRYTAHQHQKGQHNFALSHRNIWCFPVLCRHVLMVTYFSCHQQWQ